MPGLVAAPPEGDFKPASAGALPSPGIYARAGMSVAAELSKHPMRWSLKKSTATPALPGIEITWLPTVVPSGHYGQSAGAILPPMRRLFDSVSLAGGSLAILASVAILRAWILGGRASALFTANLLFPVCALLVP